MSTAGSDLCDVVYPLDCSALGLVQQDDPCLSRACGKTVGFPETLIQRLSELLVEHKALGIAAPQVGVMARVCIVRVKEPRPVRGRHSLPPEPTDHTSGRFVILRNPEIVYRSSDKAWSHEGCLSFPGIRRRVKRSNCVRVRLEDYDGSPAEMRCTGLLSRVVQHEVDHLDGRTIMDHGDWGL